MPCEKCHCKQCMDCRKKCQLCNRPTDGYYDVKVNWKTFYCERCVEKIVKDYHNKNYNTSSSSSDN